MEGARRDVQCRDPRFHARCPLHINALYWWYRKIEGETRTVRIHGLLSCECLREQPPRRDEQQVALQRRHPLVFGSIREVVACAVWRARRGIRRVELEKPRDIGLRDVREEVARDVVKELIVRPVRVPDKPELPRDDVEEEAYVTLILANEKRVPSSISFPLTNGTLATLPARSWCSGG